MGRPRIASTAVLFTVLGGAVGLAQLIDRTTALNTSGDGIALSLHQQIGAGRRDWFTEDSSSFIINRDPFAGFAGAASCFNASSRWAAARDRSWATDRATSIGIGSSAPASQTAAPPVMAGRVVQPASAETS
jgi:hypothetical protein